MSMDVSRLGIVVESSGINEARDALIAKNGKGGLYGAADKTEKAVTKLTDSLGKLMTVQNNSSGSTAAWNNSFSALQGTLTTLNRQLATMSGAINALNNAQVNITASVNSTTSAFQKKSAAGSTVINTLKAMATAAAAYISINTALSLVKDADAWQLMEAKLRNATGSLNNAQVAQQDLYDLSQRLRVPLTESVRLFARLAPAVQKSGKTYEYAKEMVEGISTALQLSGATGGEAASVMLQLSQSFSSGVLNGQEFNAVAENGSQIMRALEKYTGKTTYELKKMGSEGKLTMDVVGKAIQAALPEWRKQFDTLPVTFDGAMQRLTNAWQKAVGQMGQSTGFNAQINAAIISVEKLIPAVANGLGNAFISVMGWIEQNKTSLSAMLSILGDIASDVIHIAGDLGKWIGELTGSTDAVGGFSKALVGVRLVIAYIADAISNVAQYLLIIGINVSKYIVIPFMQAQDSVSGLNKVLAQMNLAMAKIADKQGDVAGAEDARAQAAALLETNAQNKQSIADQRKLILDMTVAQANLNLRREQEGTYVEQVLKSLQKQEDVQKKITTIADLRKMEAKTMNDKDWNANPHPTPPVDQKALKAAAAELKKYEDALESIRVKLQQQQELQQNLAKSGLDYDKVGPAMKEYIKLQEHVNVLIDKGASDQQIIRAMTLRDNMKVVASLETLNERTKEHLTAERAVTEQVNSGLKTLQDERDALKRKVEAYGEAKGAVEDLAFAQAKQRLAEMEATSDGSLTAEGQRYIEALRQQVTLLGQIADLKRQEGQLDALKAFDKLFDDRKAERFGSVLAEGFGTAGKALGQLMNSLDKYDKRQAKIAQGKKELERADKSSAAYARAAEKLGAEEAESRIASYGDMAGAAKTFFKEGSTGYKTLQAAEMTFRAFQMAMQVKSFLQESGFITTLTALFVGSKATESAAEVASVGPHIAAEGAKQGANATTALTSALAAPWPANMVAYATVAAMLAALGVAVSSGGSGKSVSQSRQESQGTGTVFGNDKAKSDSISKSLEILSKNSDIALRYSSGMLQSLQSIEQSLTGAVSGVVRSGSVTGKGYQNTTKIPIYNDPTLALGTLGAMIAGPVGALVGAVVSKIPIISNIAAALFGNKTTLKDSGLMGSSQSVANILQSGFNVKGYQDVETKKKAFGITYSTKNSTNTTAVDPAISREFGNIVSGMVDSLTSAAEVLGFSGDAIRKKLEAVNIDIGKISLKDLSSDEVQKQLEAVFSAIGDNLATVALPSVQAFQKAGEGLLETAVRVASGVESANYELEKLGINAINYADLANKNGDVGAEIVRQSILAVEKGGIAAIISTLSGQAADIASTYKSLVNVRTALQSLGIANDVSIGLIRAAGGLDAMQSALDSYTKNFFTDAEQNAMKLTALRREFDKLGVSMPTSKAAFRALVEQLSSSGASGQELAMKIIGLSDAFANLSDSTSTLIEDARGKLKDAYDAESQSLQDIIDKMGGFSDSLKEFKKSLLTGDLSTLDVAGKYSVEKNNYDSIAAKAMAGDQDAIAKFQDAAQSFLEASRAMNASGSQYTSDFEKVLAQTDLVTKATDGAKSQAQLQLEALNKQVDGLLTINTSVLTVAQAIENLTALIAQGVTAGTSLLDPKATTMPVEAPSVTTAATNNTTGADTAALVAQVAALTAEVQSLRSEQTQQAAAQQAATYEAAQHTSGGIADALSNGFNAAQYAANLQKQANSLN